MTRVNSAVTIAFGKASADNRAALVGYLPAGFPTVSGAIEAAKAMAHAGADIIETPELREQYLTETRQSLGNLPERELLHGLVYLRKRSRLPRLRDLA